MVTQGKTAGKGFSTEGRVGSTSSLTIKSSSKRKFNNQYCTSRLDRMNKLRMSVEMDPAVYSSSTISAISSTST